MTSSATTAAKLLEADERIYDPSKIEAQLSALDSEKKSLLLKMFRADGRTLSASEARAKAELIRLFKDASADIEADIFRTFTQMGGDKWDFNAVRRVGRLQQILDQMTNRVNALGAQMQSSFDDGLLDQFKQSWLKAAERLDAVTPLEQRINLGILPDREILAVVNEPWNGARFSDRLGVITDDMAHVVRHEIIKSMMAEESWQETARRIRGQMGTKGQRAVWRAEMVARTELARAQTTANAMLYGENDDVIEKVVWVAHPGACPKCTRKHGRNVDVVGYPPEDSHPNCRCAIMAVPKRLEV